MRIWIIITLLITLGVSTLSCGDEAETNSRYLEELNKQSYTETTAPTEVPVFRWDFSKKKTYTYTYEQKMQSKTDLGSTESDKDKGNVEMSTCFKGKLLIKSQGDGTATLVLKDMKADMDMDLGKDELPKKATSTMPPMVIQGMKEDGTISMGDLSQNALLKLLFPLPTKSLRVGEYVDVPTQMPFNTMGSILAVKGRSRITLTRYVRIRERTCAQLDVEIDIAELDVPEEIEGEHSCSIKGTSVFYFDIEEHCFVAGTIASVMQFAIDVPTPKVELSGEEMPDMPERTKMSMMLDSLIQISLEE